MTTAIGDSDHNVSPSDHNVNLSDDLHVLFFAKFFEYQLFVAEFYYLFAHIEYCGEYIVMLFDENSYEVGKRKWADKKFLVCSIIDDSDIAFLLKLNSRLQSLGAVGTSPVHAALLGTCGGASNLDLGKCYQVFRVVKFDRGMLSTSVALGAPVINNDIEILNKRVGDLKVDGFDREVLLDIVADASTAVDRKIKSIKEVSESIACAAGRAIEMLEGCKKGLDAFEMSSMDAMSLGSGSKDPVVVDTDDEAVAGVYFGPATMDEADGVLYEKDPTIDSDCIVAFNQLYMDVKRAEQSIISADQSAPLRLVKEFSRRTDKELSKYVRSDVALPNHTQIVALTSNLLMECDPVTFAYSDYDSFCFDMESFDFVHVCEQNDTIVDFVLRVVSDMCGSGSKKQRVSTRFTDVHPVDILRIASSLKSVSEKMRSGVSEKVFSDRISEPHFFSIREWFGTALKWLSEVRGASKLSYFSDKEKLVAICSFVEKYAKHPYYKSRHELYFQEIVGYRVGDEDFLSSCLKEVAEVDEYDEYKHNEWNELDDYSPRSCDVNIDEDRCAVVDTHRATQRKIRTLITSPSRQTEVKI